MRNTFTLTLILAAMFFAACSTPQVSNESQEIQETQSAPTFMKIAGSAEVLEPEVDFIAEAPLIDGILDRGLEGRLPVRQFGYLVKSNPENPTVDATYRLAFNASFLYLYIEMDAEDYVCRDRGYQNGDGFFMVLNKALESNEPSPDFYVLGLNPTEDPYRPFFKFIWSRNGEWPFTPLSDQTEFKVAPHGGKVGFELALRWDEIYPHHPWISEAMGFNLFFVKAIGETDNNCHIVAVDPDEPDFDFGKYTRLKFQQPQIAEGPASYLVLDENHPSEGKTVTLRTVTASSKASEEHLTVSIHSGEGSRLARQELRYEAAAGLTRHQFDLECDKLIPGGYEVRWSSSKSSSEGTFGLTVLPGLELEAAADSLERSKGNISKGSDTTLKFYLEEIGRIQDGLKPYDTSSDLRITISRVSDWLDRAAQGDDALALETGYLRRAFLSKVDDTLQPYTVRIPGDYDPGKTYPAVVFLHGSDRNDQALSRHPYVSRDDFIQIAPNGRGPLTGYTVDHAQEDIQEAVADALESYPIDPEKLVVAGFSMGGYGAYRTYYETPEKYRGVAIFSGDPSLGSKYFPDQKHPDFLQEEYLEPFKDAEVAIFHGRKDRNCPFELTDEVVGKLQAAGAHVLYRVDENLGHTPPQDKTILDDYYRWLERVVSQER
jgi:predicted esterase